MDSTPRARPGELALVFGAASRGMLSDLELLESYGARVFTATMDGSAGFRGNALELLRDLWRRRELPERVRLLACGPDPMSKPRPSSPASTTSTAGSRSRP